MTTRIGRVLVTCVAALAGLALAPLSPAGAATVRAAAAAATTSGPSAIVVAPATGITYVGFPGGGSLTRVDASGAVMSPLALTRSGPIDGLAVDGSGNIWVDYGTGVQQITPAGAELTYFATKTCGPTPPDPTKYGGIAVSSTSVYVAQECSYYLTRYSLSGSLLSEVGSSYQLRGVAFGPAQNGQPAKVYAASPDTGQVFVYSENLTATYPPGPQGTTGPPIFTLTMPKAGPNTPRPAGVAVDKYGQLAVTDVANDYVLLFDTNNVNGPNSYSWYRTLGRPGSNAGDITNATAISQYPVDGPLSDRQGDYFIADTGNSRIQRWNTSGYTYWTAATSGSGGTTPPPTAPVNTARPVVSGTPAVGQTLSCSNGTWSGSPTSYTYGWNRNGSSISGQTNNTYTVTSADSGQQLSCFVRATNAAGTSDYATSDPVTVATTVSAPTNSTPPAITGTAQQGQTLTCSNGTWTGSPTFTRVWKRNNTAISGATATTYTVTAADVGQAITCAVTATNSAGSTTVTSAAVTPTATTSNACTGTADTVSINAGAPYTTSEAVSLRIRPPSGATQVSISNDGGFDNATTQALSGTCTYAWTLALSPTPGRDTKVVYVRFLDASGTEVGQRATDDIVLDKTAPTASAAAAVHTAGAKVYTVTVKAKDTGSGLARVQYAAVRGGTGHTVAYRSTFHTRTPGQFAWTRVYDRAGNVSGWRHTVRHTVKKHAAKKHHARKARRA